MITISSNSRSVSRQMVIASNSRKRSHLQICVKRGFIKTKTDGCAANRGRQIATSCFGREGSLVDGKGSAPLPWGCGQLGASSR
ncbi:hypothetical protein JTE90_003476 [Oedothorax gibbosus]|uniref:Uncharacterized protein n=1 Tax=Oedothorax gibbosus TaxID=931172 RepID=A0AAV6UE94_9ARAC|nr:hypothetical protein JTE90_003476 [Oedothorax gibbosus]